MISWEKAKRFLEYVEHIKFLIDIVSAIAGWKISKSLLMHYTHIPPDVASALAWVFAALVLWGLLLIFGKQTSVQGNTASPAAALQNAPVNFNAQQYFAQSYPSPLYAETEQNFRTVAQQSQPNDREGFYVRFLAVGLFAYLYDTIWWTIFRSQLLALEEIVRKGNIAPLSSVRAFYDQAAKQFPTEYAGKSLDDWLAYLLQQGLIIRHPSDMIEITMRGKDFLRYLAHWGRSSTDRRL